MNKNLPKELSDFALEIGKFVQYWGFKKVHGEIWTHIYLSKEPLDAKVLTERLNISKALVSISLKDLLDYNVIKDNGKGPNSTQTYVANHNVLDVILSVLRQRELKMIAQIEMAYNLLHELPEPIKSEYNLSTERFKIMLEMIKKAQNQLKIILKLGTLDLKVWKKISFR